LTPHCKTEAYQVQRKKGGIYMIDKSRSGVRCSTVRLIRTAEGDLPRESGGTIRYETENLGRHLISVRWDKGFTMLMFSEEINVLHSDPHPPPHPT